MDMLRSHPSEVQDNVLPHKLPLSGNKQLKGERGGGGVVLLFFFLIFLVSNAIDLFILFLKRAWSFCF